MYLEELPADLNASWFKRKTPNYFVAQCLGCLDVWGMWHHGPKGWEPSQSHFIKDEVVYHRCGGVAKVYGSK